MKRTVGSVLVTLSALVVGVAGSAQAEMPRDDEGPRTRAAESTKAAPPVEATETNAATQDSGACPSGSVEVEGDYCPSLEQKCLRWLDPDLKLRCAEFAPTGKCQTKTVHKRFCMDAFEYPNKVGEKPIVMKTWYEARDACQNEGKRLCTESEWTTACEGEARTPYPYGNKRNAETCNIDKPHPDVNEFALSNPKTRMAEAARLDQRAASGEYAACVSPHGVHDMTGNVDEWVVNESGGGFKSGLKGGYWGPVRTRCRPMTTAHGPDFSYYQIGFRCCGDAPERQEAKKGAGVINLQIAKIEREPAQMTRLAKSAQQ